MDEDGPNELAIDFVPALCFVQRGVTKERLEKIVLTKSEVARVIQEAKEHLESDDDDDDDEAVNSDNMQVDADAPGTSNHNAGDAYNFNNYEEEENTTAVGIANIVDPDAQLSDEDSDSEAGDEIVKPTDNLLLVGHVQDEASSMEVWIFNEEEESLYTLHDFLLPSFPLCIEWLNHDPGSDKLGNMCAIGCMDPVITVWDLDIIDSIEPTFRLGSKGSRKRNKKRFGHKDAVLDLSWNRNFEHILASASVDKTVMLWDLDEGQPHTTITAFEDKVQSLEFHANEGQIILTGCADGLVRLFDCRDPETVNNTYLKWKIPGEVEKVLWNPCDGNYFIVGTNEGNLIYADKRQPDSTLWTKKGHAEEISGICFNNQMPNLLTTTSTEGTLKIWNFNASELKEIYTHDFNMGRLQCMKQSPDDPYTLAFGGEKAPRCRVYNIKNFEAVRRVFNIPEVLQ